MTFMACKCCGIPIDESEARRFNGWCTDCFNLRNVEIMNTIDLDDWCSAKEDQPE
jgi:NMD protein affecting ribosome stability and mRNA decay